MKKIYIENFKSPYFSPRWPFNYLLIFVFFKLNNPSLFRLQLLSTLAVLLVEVVLRMVLEYWKERKGGVLVVVLDRLKQAVDFVGGLAVVRAPVGVVRAHLALLFPQMTDQAGEGLSLFSFFIFN
jgi:hypothetical protein